MSKSGIVSIVYLPSLPFTLDKLIPQAAMFALAHRLQAAGYRVLCYDDATVQHVRELQACGAAELGALNTDLASALPQRQRHARRLRAVLRGRRVDRLLSYYRRRETPDRMVLLAEDYGEYCEALAMIALLRTRLTCRFELAGRFVRHWAHALRALHAGSGGIGVFEEPTSPHATITPGTTWLPEQVRAEDITQGLMRLDLHRLHSRLIAAGKFNLLSWSMTELGEPRPCSTSRDDIPSPDTRRDLWLARLLAQVGCNAVHLDLTEISEWRVHQTMHTVRDAFDRQFLALSLRDPAWLGEHPHLMGEIACVAADVSLPSGSQRLLEDFFRMRTGVGRCENGLRLLREAGVSTGLRLQYPCPWDDYHTAAETARFIARTKPDTVAVDAVVPSPASPWYGEPAHYGFRISGRMVRRWLMPGAHDAGGCRHRDTPPWRNAFGNAKEQEAAVRELLEQSGHAQRPAPSALERLLAAGLNTHQSAAHGKLESSLPAFDAGPLEAAAAAFNAAMTTHKQTRPSGYTFRLAAVGN
ncbi:MAG: hypothetical protein HYV27_18965 [Candidatus Hydrogenedentes bacterium]|nr:hypothetical protein [Candidatus Hydrogenedentota bacterium]